MLFFYEFEYISWHPFRSISDGSDVTEVPSKGIDNHLNWKNHINQLVQELSGACYAVRSVLHISNTDTLRSIYFACFHSLMKYAIIFWDNSSDSKRDLHCKRKLLD
jgi:hypothetical protein